MPDRPLADENIPAGAIDAFRDAGCDVLSIREIAPGIADAEVLRLAVNQSRLLVTFDRDYGELIFRQGFEPPPSIIYFRALPASPHEVREPPIYSSILTTTHRVGTLIDHHNYFD